MAGIQPLAADTVGVQPGNRLLQIRTRTRQDGVCAVIGRHRQAGELVGEALDTVGLGEDRRHPPARGQVAEKPAPLSQQACTVLQAENTGDAGRRVLPDAVAEDHVGLETPRLPEPGQAHFHGEDRGLGVSSLLQRLRAGRAVIGTGPENNLQQWSFEDVGNRLRATGHGLGEHRFAVEQLLGHAEVLTALPREQPRRLGLVGGIPPDQPRRRPVVGQRSQQIARGFHRIDHQGGAVFKVGPGRAGGQTDVGQRGLGVIAEPVAIVLRGRGQGRRCARGQRQQHEPAVVGLFGRHRGDRCVRRLLNNHVGVGAGEPERTDPGNPGPIAAFPGEGLVHHAHRDSVPGDMRGGVAEVQVFGQFGMLQRQDDLQNSGNPGGGFKVSDIRLRRADEQWLGGIPLLAQSGGRGLDLDGITQRCPGPVCLQVVDVARRKTRAFQRLGDHPLLGDAVGHRQAARCTVLVHGAAPDHRADVIAVSDRVLEALDRDDTAALAANVAVGRRVERLASAVGCQHPRLGEGDHGGRAENGVGAAGQRQVAFTQPQRLACLMDRHQRGTAGRVDGDRGALQPEPVTDPPRPGRTGGTDRQIGLDIGVIQSIRRHGQVVVGR